MFWKYAANLQENNHAEKQFYQDHTPIQRIFNYLKVKEYFLIYISSDFVGILQNNCFTKNQIDYVVKVFEKCQNDLRILNQIFRNDVTYDHIKSHKKPSFSPSFSFSRRYIFWKTTALVKKAKIFWSYVRHFRIFAGVRKHRILIGLCK